MSRATARSLALCALGLALAFAAGCDFAGPPAGPSDDGDPIDDPGDGDGDGDGDSAPRTVSVHLFEWSHAAVARECENVLGPAGFAAVQVSPPQEHAVFPDGPWWERYQPVSYAIDSRSGDRASFADMVERCGAAGVAVYVDAVLNHMSFLDQGVGSAGTEFSRYSYPGLYDDDDFHDCRRGIVDYSSRDEVQNCDLATAPDLDTGSSEVRATLAAYLADLSSLGVAGFRIDGAKHIAAEDLAVILGEAGGSPAIVSEVIDFGGEAISAAEYSGFGRVTEFRYSSEIARVFRGGQLSWLEHFGEAWGMMPSADALVFVDNHDNQRGHGFPADALSFRDGRLHELANIFALAWPYGSPRIMSSYAFDDGDQGPPAEPANDACDNGWICEHRRPSMRAMAGFRNRAGDAPVTRWWSNGNDQIAFAREGAGFVAINREELSSVSEVLATDLEPGRYCDVLAGEPTRSRCAGRVIEVGVDGTALIELGSLDAIAIHAGARID